MSAAGTWLRPRLLAIGAFLLGTVPANARQSLPLRKGSDLLLSTPAGSATQEPR